MAYPQVFGKLIANKSKRNSKDVTAIMIKRLFMEEVRSKKIMI
jgi:hypothetical protein